jgi:hypothetical protein
MQFYGFSFLKLPLLFQDGVAIGILTTATAAHAPMADLDSRHDDLDRVRRAASDSSDAAEEAKSKYDDFEDCKQDPDLHGLAGDGFRSERSAVKRHLAIWRTIWTIWIDDCDERKALALLNSASIEYLMWTPLSVTSKPHGVGSVRPLRTWSAWVWHLNALKMCNSRKPSVELRCPSRDHSALEQLVGDWRGNLVDECLAHLRVVVQDGNRAQFFL